MKTYNKIVIGIDQSYKRTGITVLVDRKIFKMYSLVFGKEDNNTTKRLFLRKSLERTIEDILDVYECEMGFDVATDIKIITERIRLKSQGFVSENYLKSTSALVSTIIDTAENYNINVYSVDTRAWKSAIVGTSKPVDNPYGIDPHKYPTILYMRRMGLLRRIAEPYEGRGKKGIIPIKIEGKKVPCKINDDLADSYCIAMYGFLPKGKQKLKEEVF